MKKIFFKSYDQIDDKVRNYEELEIGENSSRDVSLI